MQHKKINLSKVRVRTHPTNMKHKFPPREGVFTPRCRAHKPGLKRTIL